MGEKTPAGISGDLAKALLGDQDARASLAAGAAGAEVARRAARLKAGEARAAEFQMAGEMAEAREASRRVTEQLAELDRRERRRKLDLETAALGTYDELMRLNHGIVALRRAQDEADERQRETDATVVRLERENVLYAGIGIVLAAATFAAVVVGTLFAVVIGALGAVLLLMRSRGVSLKRGERRRPDLGDGSAPLPRLRSRRRRDQPSR